MKLHLLLMQIFMYFSKFNSGSLWSRLETPQLALAFLQAYGVVRKTGSCDLCNTAFPPPCHRDDQTYTYFKCKTCNHEESIFKHSYLYQKNITAKSFTLFAYHFCMSEVGGYIRLNCVYFCPSQSFLCICISDNTL